MMSLDIQTIEAQANLLRSSGHIDEADTLIQLHERVQELLGGQAGTDPNPMTAHQLERHLKNAHADNQRLVQENRQLKARSDALLTGFDRVMNALIDTNEEVKRLRREMDQAPYNCDYYEAYLREKARANRWHSMCKSLLEVK